MKSHCKTKTEKTRRFLSTMIAVLLAATWNASAAPRPQPNFIIIFADDQGYGDLGCFGSATINTPQLDRMAREGRKFTSFVVASSVCSPSRAALLTGCYPKRVGLHQGVLFPGSNSGLNPDEDTIADHLRSRGYATACFGKWHLGHHPEVLPTGNGFDTYFGIPYSNDMNHPANKGQPKMGPKGMDILWKDPDSTLSKWNTPLMEDGEIVELPVDQRTITRRYTDKSIEFARNNKDRPFFIYLPHSMPHIPLYVPQDAYDPDPKNAYKSVIEHMDAEVGRLLDAIRELGIEENTYVIYTSDNGPWSGSWASYAHHAGSSGPLRDGKGSTFEGGHRVPFVIWGPGRIPANTECHELMSSIDLLPTFASLAGIKLPDSRRIDGLDATSLLTEENPKPVRKEFLYYSRNGALEGIRQGQWKLLVKKKGRKRANKESGSSFAPGALLFDLSEDIGESNNLAGSHPDRVQALMARMRELDAEIETNARSPWVKK